MLRMIDRRAFLRSTITTGSVVAATALAKPAYAATSVRSEPQFVTFRNTHTNESFSGSYRVGDHYMGDAMKRINYVLRDFRTDEVHAISPKTIDILSTLLRRSGSRGSFEIISGYRSPRTNAMLRGRSSGVAKKSLHMEGKAIDMNLPGVELSSLRRMAIDLRAGGVGYYPRSNFVHVDCGDVRSWS